MGLAPDSKNRPTIKLFTTPSSSSNSGFRSYSKEVIPLTDEAVEKFDDIKFGKVLTKLYARLFTMEQTKYLPPKYSYAIKDLAEFLGIFEITEDALKRVGGDISDTSSNISYVTSSAFKPKKSQLDVIRE